MSRIINLSRRQALQGAAVSSLVLGFRVNGWSPMPMAHAARNGHFTPNVYVSIDGSGVITVTAPRMEMGTGIKTSLAMVLADELDADWENVTIVQAPGDPRYGDQNTDGSRSVRLFFLPLRQAGASARQMLIEAAAQRWGLPASSCHTDSGAVLSSNGKRLSYGQLAAQAGAMPVPDAKSLSLKSPDQWRYVGKPLPAVDLADIVHGHAIYGIDVTLPGMKYASIERPPSYGGKLRHVDDTEALRVRGVERVVQIPTTPPPSGFMLLGGVAVIATNTWAAQQGRQKLKRFCQLSRQLPFGCNFIALLAIVVA